MPWFQDEKLVRRMEQMERQLGVLGQKLVQQELLNRKLAQRMEVLEAERKMPEEIATMERRLVSLHEEITSQELKLQTLMETTSRNQEQLESQKMFQERILDESKTSCEEIAERSREIQEEIQEASEEQLEIASSLTNIIATAETFLEESGEILAKTPEFRELMVFGKKMTVLRKEAWLIPSLWKVYQSEQEDFFEIPVADLEILLQYLRAESAVMLLAEQHSYCRSLSHLLSQHQIRLVAETSRLSHRFWKNGVGFSVTVAQLQDLNLKATFWKERARYSLLPGRAFAEEPQHLYLKMSEMIEKELIEEPFPLGSVCRLTNDGYTGYFIRSAENPQTIGSLNTNYFRSYRLDEYPGNPMWNETYVLIKLTDAYGIRSTPQDYPKFK